MARPVSQEREREYAELNAFLDMYATHFMKIDPASPTHPTNAGKRIVAAVGKSKALIGLRQAINDSLEALQDLTPEQVAQLDRALRQSGIITLTELRRRHSRKYKAIFKRGVIRNEMEYYMVKAVLDGCAVSLSDTELTHLGSMLMTFEQAANKSVGSFPSTRGA